MKSKFRFYNKSSAKSNPKPEVKANISNEPVAKMESAIGACSYIGPKGYTIPKSALTLQELTKLRAELSIAPELGSAAAMFCGAPTTAFPVFRENDAKIYIPRFYGISKYGNASAKPLALSRGLPVLLTFAQTLRDYQIEISNLFVAHVNGDKTSNTSGPFGGGILEVKTGKGKTVIALHIAARLGLKTLIIVHKEFLADQWTERIAEFLPGASVGRIQGSTFDIEGRDIVIGMVQTLYKRVFAENTFACFGLTVIDEVHRIGSEEFSKTLLKIVTPVMLGISATVERKDKLERLLYMFIGERVYQDTTRSEDEVCVRAIDYIHADPALVIPLLDARGNPAFSAMMSRLCVSTHRNDFVVRVLSDLVRESPTSQIMVLAHQRAMLTYIYEKLVANNIATAGFYIGGTKPEVLKATEEKQIVLATFSMAAEALDIKTLSTLFMITPKSDIVQSVGRILRAKHTQPIIVDLVDAPIIFKNQFRKRLAFYKGNNYRVRRISGDAYCGFEDMCKWRTIYTPTSTKSSLELKDVPQEEENEEEEQDSENESGKCQIIL